MNTPIDSDPEPKDGNTTAQVPGNAVSIDADDWLDVCLNRLAEHGSVADPVELRAYLPDLDRDGRRTLLIELVKLDMAMSADSGRIRLIAEYLSIDECLLSADSVPIDLVMEEMQLRMEIGDPPDASEYQLCYPHLATMLTPLEQSIAGIPSAVEMKVPPEANLGDQIDDFLILQKLGRGAFAHVYLAQQISMRRLVALKVSRGKGGESQSLAQFDHPNIVRVFDQRLIENSSLHLLYMQFVPGGTLADVVQMFRSCRAQDNECKIGGAILLRSVDEQLLEAAQVVPDQSSTREWIADSQWPQVVAWVGFHLCRALHEAHSQNILHRDVKPANVLLSAEGIPKLADFNVSFSDSAEQAGQAASLGGSLGYMSPEHVLAIIDNDAGAQDKIREPADLYSLAVLLWELWQGQRPFPTAAAATSWKQAAADQLAARHRPIVMPDCQHQNSDAAERVLAKTLCRALSVEPSDRFANGAEMAGRLRLSLYPQAATLFDPPESSWRAWLSHQSPWMMACAVLLIPHAFAGGLNYQYNMNEVMQTDQLKSALQSISWIVNLTYFPLATVFAVLHTRSMVRAVENARQNQRVDSRDLGNMLELGQRAALIGGSMWISSGILFPLIFHSMSPDFHWMASMQLFLSSLICGGIAMAYPYFGMAWLATFVFYPLCLRNTMQDADFDARAARMTNRGEVYTLIAAILPLVGGVLMMSSPSLSRWFMLTAVVAGMLGLVVATSIQQRVVKAWTQMGQVLSTKVATIPI
ncbi:serine/threonine protein kinase [Rubripirellula reticaptiva]|uniref:Serine/threonine-protein kinase PrkC n=1 Tax=Rubripirellula reticaptiva TaxID=2528013 RepID=A0A5C6ETB1_9BACT|nr:serine/threonine-protein kinase [Rubripirellula reticaptiva]TWU51624.1 Serine/threonine-protein kinase PrkC [Rubripirellula reticaptiva]